MGDTLEIKQTLAEQKGVLTEIDRNFLQTARSSNEYLPYAAHRGETGTSTVNNAIDDLYSEPKPEDVGELYKKLVPTSVFIPDSGRKRHILEGKHAKGFRDQFCGTPKMSADKFESITSSIPDNMTANEHIAILNMARQMAGDPPETVCDRGSGVGGSEKALELDKTAWGLLTTNSLLASRFIMTAVAANAEEAPVAVGALIGKEMRTLEEGEIDFNEWPQDKKNEFLAKLTMCKRAFRLYESKEDGTLALSYVVYNGTISSAHEMCMGAMEMVTPPAAENTKKEENEADAIWWPGMEQEKKAPQHGLDEMKDYLGVALAGIPHREWVHLVAHSKTELGGWKPALKYGTYTVAIGTGAAVALGLVGRVLWYYETTRRVLVAGAAVTGLSSVGGVAGAVLKRIGGLLTGSNAVGMVIFVGATLIPAAVEAETARAKKEQETGIPRMEKPLP